MVINHSPAPSATTKAQYYAIWRSIKESTQVLNHSAAPSVTINAQPQVLWRDMKEFTLVINHFAAPIVTTNAQRQAIWRNMKESIQVINHSAALDATYISQWQQVWESMKADFTRVSNRWSIVSSFFHESKKSQKRNFDYSLNWQIIVTCKCESTCSLKSNKPLFIQYSPSPATFSFHFLIQRW